MKPTKARVYWDEAAWSWKVAATLVALDLAGLAVARFVVGWSVVGPTGSPQDPLRSIVGNWSIVTRALLAMTFVMYFIGKGVPPRAFGLVKSGVRRRLTEFGKSLAVILPLAAATSVLAILVLRAGGGRHLISAPVRFETLEQQWIWIWIFVVALPPVEELIYRGVLHPVLRRHMDVSGAVVIGGLLFGLLHWFYGIDVASLPAYALGGAALAFVYERTGSLFFPWLLHVATNAAGVWISTYPGFFEALRA